MAEKARVAVAAAAVAAAAASSGTGADSPQLPYVDEADFDGQHQHQHQLEEQEQDEEDPQQSWNSQLPPPQATFGPDFTYPVGESEDTSANSVGPTASMPGGMDPGSSFRPSQQSAQQQHEHENPFSDASHVIDGGAGDEAGSRALLTPVPAALTPGGKIPLRAMPAVMVAAGQGTPLSGRAYAHLLEEGMTPDELRRLEEEERALDEAIEQRGKK